MSTDPLLAISRALAPKWEEQRRSFNGASYRQCLHCQGTTARGHDADCVGEAARRAVAEVGTELARLRAVEAAARALAEIVSLDVEPWDPNDEGSIAYCRHCHAPDYRPHRDDCEWKREQAIRDRFKAALSGSAPDPRDERIRVLEAIVREVADGGWVVAAEAVSIPRATYNRARAALTGATRRERP